MPSAVRRLTGFVSLCLAIAAVSCAFATRTPEYRVKAAFLFNFSKFVSGPPPAFSSANAPLAIGVLATTPSNQSFRQSSTAKP